MIKLKQSVVRVNLSLVPKECLPLFPISILFTVACNNSGRTGKIDSPVLLKRNG
jgi:hypothetical protein